MFNVAFIDILKGTLNIVHPTYRHNHANDTHTEIRSETPTLPGLPNQEYLTQIALLVVEKK